MTKIRQIIKRDIGVKLEGVVKVFDRSALATEVREYVVTDKIEKELKVIVDTFTHASDTLRRGGAGRDVMGMWISGFFGSGKSHFAKVLGYLFQNDTLDDRSDERCIDAFLKHLSDTPRGQAIKLRLGEIKRTTQAQTIAFEAKSRQSLGSSASNVTSIGEILLSEFYRHIGLAENVVVARIERRLQQRGLLDKLAAAYQEAYGVAWTAPGGRDDLLTVRRRLGEILPNVDKDEYPDERTAKNALADMFRHEKITAEGIANELVAWVDEQTTTGGKVQHLFFVIDEMGTFIGDSSDKIGELNSLAEMIGNKGKGKVWLIVTSQQDLEAVVDRVKFQPALVGRLNARFELRPHLISDEINKVVAERILKKHPSEEQELRELYRRNEGHIADLSDLKASRSLGSLAEQDFVDAYPFLPHQIRLAQDIFEKLSGFRISGGVRSMIAVVMDALQDVADQDVGVIVSFDRVFDAVENDLLSQDYLGASGVRAIMESNQRVGTTPVAASRVLKVLWLLRDLTWVPRVPETLAKLLVRDLSTDIAPLRNSVEVTLRALQEAGYVARDEATGEWKYLNERERTIEQTIQEMVRSGGPKTISMAAIRRTAQDMCKTEIITKKKLASFSVTHGMTKVPFSFGVRLDGEAVETGPEIEVHFTGPLSPSRKQDLEEAQEKNAAAGAKGRVAFWIADSPENLETRLKRYEALVKVTSDKRFTEDPSKDTADALSEKRKERDELRSALVRELERAFLTGTLLYGGQEEVLDRETDLKEPIKRAFQTILPNVFPLFSIADRPFDFAKQLRALLNPATTALSQVAPDLGLFDSQGSLHRDSALVEPVLDILSELADQGQEPNGARLLEASDEKARPRGFSQAPFGWPDELVRLILAACFRSGAIYLERQSAAGPAPLYDYREADELFSKITLFKKHTFRVAETSLTLDQIKQAAKALIAMGVSGVTESGNALAAAVRDLGSKLNAALQEAKARHQQGLPIGQDILGAEGALTEPTTAKDPTVVVRAFLDKAATWKALHRGLGELRTFLAASRDQEYESARRLLAMAENHPIPDAHPKASTFTKARKDMDAIVAEKAVVHRWADYRGAFEAATAAYRDAYTDAYLRVQKAAESTLAAIKSGTAYAGAPTPQRDQVLAGVFGPGRPCYYEALSIGSPTALLQAAGKRSLTSLDQALVALPGYRAHIEAELTGLAAPPPTPGEKVLEWRPVTALAGKRFKTEDEVDRALDALRNELKAHVREGFTIVVK